MPSDKIGLKDNFFDLGGNSLLMIKMLSMLNKEFKTNISLVTGFSLSNIFTISEYIKSDSQDNLQEQETEELYNIMEESFNLLNFNENEE